MPCTECHACPGFAAKAQDPHRCATCFCARSSHTDAAAAAAAVTPQRAPTSRLRSPSATVAGEKAVWWPMKETHSSFRLVQLQVELLEVNLRNTPRSLFKERSKLRRAAASLASFGSKTVDVATLRGNFHVRFKVCGPPVSGNRPPRPLNPPEDLDNDVYTSRGQGRTEPAPLSGTVATEEELDFSATQPPPQPFVSWACVPYIRLPVSPSCLSVTTVSAELWFDAEPRLEPVMLAEVIIKGHHLYEPTQQELLSLGRPSHAASPAAAALRAARKRGSSAGSAEDESEVLLPRVAYVRKRMAIPGGGSCVLSIRASPAAWRKRRYACDTVEGTTLRQSYQFPSSSAGHLLVHEECTEVAYASLVPCQFFRRRCESLKLQREILMDRLHECAVRLAQNKAKNGGSAEDTARARALSSARRRSVDPGADLLQMLSGVYGMTEEQPTDEEDRVAWLHDHLERYSRAITKYTHLVDYFSTLYLKARRFSGRSRRFGRDPVSQMSDLVRGINRSKAFFKPSARKKDPLVCAVPINLHLQSVSVQEVGAPGYRPAVARRQSSKITPIHRRGGGGGGVGGGGGAGVVAGDPDGHEPTSHRTSTASLRRRRASMRMAQMRTVRMGLKKGDPLASLGAAGSDNSGSGEHRRAGGAGSVWDAFGESICDPVDVAKGVFRDPADVSAATSSGGSGTVPSTVSRIASPVTLGVPSNGTNGAASTASAASSAAPPAGDCNGDGGGSHAGSPPADDGSTAVRATIRQDAAEWLSILSTPPGARAAIAGSGANAMPEPSELVLSRATSAPAGSAAPDSGPPSEARTRVAVGRSPPPPPLPLHSMGDDGTARSTDTAAGTSAAAAAADVDGGTSTTPARGPPTAAKRTNSADLASAASEWLTILGSPNVAAAADIVAGIATPTIGELSVSTAPHRRRSITPTSLSESWREDKNAVLRDVTDADRRRLPATEYTTVTLGAPAHHAFGFHKGGLHRLRQRVPGLKPGVCASAFVEEWVALSGDLGLLPGDDADVVGHGEHALPRHAVETAFGVQLREDAVLAQALAALVTAFTSRVDELLVGDREQLLALLPHAGFLLHLESLLSTAGNEIGMLEDLVIAFHLLSKVVIVLRDEDDDGPGDDPASDGTSPATPSPGASAFHARRGVGTPLAAGSPSVPHAEPTPHFGLPGTHTGASDTESGEDEDDPRLHMLLTLRHLHRLRIYSGSQYEAIRGQVQYVTAEGSAPATPAAAASRTPQRTPHAAGGSVDDSAAVQGTHTASRSAASRPTVRRVQSARAVSAPSAGSRPAAIAAALGGTKPGGAGVPTPASPARRPTPNFVVELVLPHRLLLSLPEELRRCAVPVVPIMFTQGINEMQTIANAISESGLQHAINEHSLSMLRGFVRKWGNLQAGQNRRRVERKLKTLEEAVRMEGLASGKHYGVLTLSSDIVRELHGARLTCCKSGKDRTAMSVTLEQARQLAHNHGLARSFVSTAANVMRGHGVRLEVCRKNIGKPRYAFNALQVKLLPSVYRPPAHTTSSNVST